MSGALPIRVAVVDDQAMIRMGIRMIVEHEPDLEVVGEAADGEEAVRLAAAAAVEVVLMDIRMPGTDGIEATRRIRSDPALAGTRVIVLTTFDDEAYVTGALHAGADAFLLKDAGPQTLVDAVRRVHAGASVLDAAVTGLVLDQWRRSHRGPGRAGSAPSLDGLTERERDVLLLVARGASNSEAAEALCLSLATVKAHVHAVLVKTGCTARTQLVVLAYETGLVVPGDD